jgi:hypothetical protein
MKQQKLYLLVGSVVLLTAVLIAVYKAGFFSIFLKSEATMLGGVVLIGLALVVLLVAALAIIFAVLELASKDQPLALPEGSVRALIAFSLVLIFVLLGAFLYKSVTDLGPCSTLTRITKAEIDELNKDYVVFSVPAKNADGTPAKDDKQNALYDVTYYVKHNKDADDFAKQIFTTLATVFVSVISFYFGTSAATSGAGAIAKAIGGNGGKKAAPSIVKLDPDNIAGDSPPAALKIIGERLGTVTKVRFGTDEAKPDNVADKLVIVKVPQSILAARGIVKVSVVGDNGESSTLDLTIH